MCGADTFTESLFTMRKLEDCVSLDHPLRTVRVMVNQALGNLDELFSRMYEAGIKSGRPSIAPEKLLRAMPRQVFYSIRSGRQLMEQIRYNLLCRPFIACPWMMPSGCPLSLPRSVSAPSSMTP